MNTAKSLLAVLLLIPPLAAQTIHVVDGNVGIGTQTPSNTLDVRGSGARFDGWFNETTSNSGVYLGRNPSDSTPRILFANGNSGQNWQIDNNAGTFRWYLPGAEQMTLSPATLTLINKNLVATGSGNSYFLGNVGIGTANPIAKLDVAGAINVAGGSWITGNANGLIRDTNFGYGPSWRVIQIGTQIGSEAGNSQAISLGIDPTTVPGGAFYGDEIALPNFVEFMQANSAKTDWIQNVLVLSSGNVGIGTATPGGVLHVHTPSNSDTNQPRFLSGATTAGNWNEILLGANVGTYDSVMFRYFNGLGSAGASLLNIIHYGDTTGISLKGGGNVGIGTTNPTHRLTVNGQVKAKGFVADTSNWADFVFEPDYPLAPLPEVEAHIREKGHLPGIPSAAEVREQGVDLMAMQVKLLQKVEELTLHLIRMEKENSALRERVQTLETLR